MSLFGEFGQLAPGYGEGRVDQPCFRKGGLGLKASAEVFFFSESFSDDGRSNKIEGMDIQTVALFGYM